MSYIRFVQLVKKEAPRDARAGIGDYFRFYNTERPHQALGYRTPAEVFTSIPVEATNGGMVESLTPDTLKDSGTHS